MRFVYIWYMYMFKTNSYIQIFQRRVTSSSSVPKSTSSMTLPVSSPSTHSQFEDCQGGQQFIPVSEVFQTSEGHTSPQDVEKRLDELTR